MPNIPKLYLGARRSTAQIPHQPMEQYRKASEAGFTDMSPQTLLMTRYSIVNGITDAKHQFHSVASHNCIVLPSCNDTSPWVRVRMCVDDVPCNCL